MTKNKSHSFLWSGKGILIYEVSKKQNGLNAFGFYCKNLQSNDQRQQFRVNLDLTRLKDKEYLLSLMLKLTFTEQFGWDENYTIILSC